MTAGVTRLSDLIVPEVFTPYVQNITREKSRLIQSGALMYDASLSAKLAGGGLTFNDSFFQDLDNDEENISNDDPDVKSSPNKIGTGSEIQVRMSRNNSWSSMDLVKNLIGDDPMARISDRVAAYWVRRQQALFVATVNGVLAMDAAAPANGSTHTQNDLIHDVSGTAFKQGVTNFTAEGFIDTTTTMGDDMDRLTMIMVHSVVYARMLKNNLIDFMVDATNPNAVRVPTFLGREVIVDDGVPNSNGVFQNWLFAAGAFVHAAGAPPVPTAIVRDEKAGNGSGQETLINRVEWIIHPTGHAYIGSPPMGGPSNAATANNLAAATSWRRAFRERKQIGIASFVTREY